MTGDRAGGLLGPLVLARETVDRASELRNDPAWQDAAWASPQTRVLVVDHGRALARVTGGQAELVFIRPAQAPPGVRFLLGVDDERIAYFGVSAPLEGTDPGAPADARGTGPGRDPGGAGADGVPRPMSLREAGSLLGDRDVGLLTHAVAVANWHDTHTHCPIDGTPTVVNPGGHSTTCPADGTEHFPRTDPAVIMLVSDPEDRCLLARNKAWPERRVSILAGFVDPGESAEHAVIREVHEEIGITVERVTYLGSQPWPLPRSLMLGYRAHAVADLTIRVDTDEISEAHWYSREDLIRVLEAGELALPPAVSIARRIIEAWYGGELPDGASTWTR
ncbi:MAG TPA: NAD(+) diphosphatase [Streptosporangiaceae bacterium]|nr:NAD(+) diphosphatase [Streptosporangiaceae bacterium]